MKGERFGESKFLADKLAVDLNCEVCHANVNIETACDYTSKNDLEMERGSLLLIIYGEKEYPGEITRFGGCSARVNVMRQIFTGKWKPPESKDYI